MLVLRASRSVSQTAWVVGTHVLLVWLTSCSVYDTELVRSINAAESRARAGAEGMRDDPVITPSGVASDASAGPSPDDTTARRGGGPGDVDDGGSVSTARCGDGQVSGVEKCDTAIKAGEPGACPSDCPDLERCVPRVLNGTGCQTECVLRGLTCESGDGCCPGNCTRDNDLDCSSRCGDGIVQTTSGETCEPETDKPCLTNAAACDDENACTHDSLIGSPSNCNVACLHEPVEMIGPEDGCCPRGGNARSDPDCDPSCGNGVKEDGEDCDGGDGCGVDCRFVNGEERMRCAEQAKTDCERCACERCTATELACRGSSSPGNNRLCGDIITCSQQNNCIGTSCYCGAAMLGCTIPAGPCRGEIEAAGGTPLQVATQVGDPNTLVGKSYAADQCRVAQCADVCR